MRHREKTTHPQLPIRPLILLTDDRVDPEEALLKNQTTTLAWKKSSELMVR